jgi:DnaJ-class molecular chaperone
MQSHNDPCQYCGGSGTIMRRVMFRDGRLFPVLCDWCRGTGRHA